MGAPAARINDMHVCPMVTGTVPHVGGPILPPGEPTVLIGGMPAAKVGDMATCTGPPDSIVAGSGTVLIVSNRWGRTIFESDDYNYNNLWDGGDNPDGTYYYRLDIPGKGVFKGWIEIWRGGSR